MEQVLRSLSGLVLQAVPTIIIVVILHFYLKYVYFQPMQRVLKARFDATEGARRLAEESLRKAAEKASEYEAAIRAARAEIFREQEKYRERLRAEHGEAVREARQGADAMVKEARKQIADELAVAKRSLEQQTETLAGQIVNTILRRRVA
jgi:F-type H+-transporting ATPase subunit b